MKVVSATDANRDFSRLLDEVVKSGPIAITKRGKIVATINPAVSVDADLEEHKKRHLKLLRARKPIPGLSRGTREELYDD